MKRCNALFGRERLSTSSTALMLRLFDTVIEIARKNQYPITHFSCTLRKGNLSLKPHQCYSMKSKGKILKTLINKGYVKEYSLYSLPYSDSSPAFDWDFVLSVMEDSASYLTVYWGMDENISMNFNSLDAEMNDSKGILHTVREFLKIDYGFSMSMPRKYNPAGYIIGIPGMCPKYLVYDANIWRKKIRILCDRKLRNVYPINILSSNHLKIPVNGKLLKDLIVNSQYGKLDDFDENLYLWVLSGDLNIENHQVAFLREKLCQHAVFAWQEFL